MKGHLFSSLKMLDDAAIPEASLKGVSSQQRQEHRRMLSWMLQMPPQLRDLPLPAAVLSTLLLKRRQRSWCPSTWEKTLGSTMGAMARLSEYTTSVVDLPLNGTSQFKDALRAASRQVTEWEHKPPPPATLEQVVRVVAAAPAHVKAQILLAWLTAARVGCILQLKASDVTWDGSNLTVQFRRGKGARVRGPYTVFSTCSNPEWGATLTAALSNRQGFLWPFLSPKARSEAGRQITLALRQLDPALEQRSLRRGALQAMAAAGASDQQMLTYSGHTNVAMLHRYLDWGKKGEKRAKEAREAAAALQAPRPRTSGQC
jgi:integrase